MRRTWTIARHAIADELHYKSFYVLFAIAIALVLMAGGCYRGSFVMNGASMENQEFVRMVAGASFHFIAVAAMLLVALLSARSFRTDRENGTLVFILAKPVGRWEYALGKLAGLFVIALAFMLALHLAVFASALVFPKTPSAMPMLLVSSLAMALNLLLVIGLVLFLALYLPDFIAILFAAGIVVVGYLTGPVYGLIDKANAGGNVWAVVIKTMCVIWPQTGPMQAAAGALLDGSAFTAVGLLHPAINLAIWIAAFAGVLVWRFERQEL